MSRLTTMLRCCSSAAACLLLLVAAAACEKKPPTYVLKAEAGEAAVIHYDDMKDQPKYMKIRRAEYDKKKAIMERRIAREEARGIYRKESRWDY